jgi:hypothetical protein
LAGEASEVLPLSAVDVSTPDALLSVEGTSFLGAGLVLIFLSSVDIVFPNADWFHQVDPLLKFIRRYKASWVVSQCKYYVARGGKIETANEFRNLL